LIILFVGLKKQGEGGVLVIWFDWRRRRGFSLFVTKTRQNK